MASPSSQGKSNPLLFKTPDKAECAGDEEARKFAEHGLTPPTTRHPNTFDGTVKKVKADFKNVWESGTMEEKRILLFLYCRGSTFLDRFSQQQRGSVATEFLQAGAVRERMKMILDTEGDIDKSETLLKHYVANCIVLLRWFQQPGASGFLEDMSELRVYLRNQRFGSCFLQSACVCVSYLLQCYRLNIPPLDASRFIRHNLTLDQLKRYVVKDEGGDSAGVYKIMLKQFLEYNKKDLPMSSIDALELEVDVDGIKRRLSRCPCLVTKFEFNNFDVDRNGADGKKPGYARFKNWGEKGEWRLLEKPQEEALQKREEKIKEKLRESCLSHPETYTVESMEDVDIHSLTTAATSSMSFDDDNTADRCPSPHTPSEIAEVDSRSDEATSTSLSSEDWNDDEDVGEGDAAYHAMVLLGVRDDEEDGETYWLVQNSWSKVRLAEMSTSYLSQSGAFLVFVLTDHCSPRKKTRAPLQVSPCKVTESHAFEGADTEDWCDHLVSSGELNQGASEPS